LTGPRADKSINNLASLRAGTKTHPLQKFEEVFPMRKVLALVLILILALSLAACGFGGTGGTTAKPGKDLGGEPVDKTEKAGDFTVKAVSVVTNSGGAFAPEEGNMFVLVKLQVQNNGTETVAISSLLMCSATADGAPAEASMNAISIIGALKGASLDGDIKTGETLEGYYAVEAPANAKTLELTFNPDWPADGGGAVFVINIP